MGIFFIIVAAIFAAGSNFFLRRGIDAHGSSKTVLPIQLTFSFLLMVLLNPVRVGDFSWENMPAFLGLIGGVILGCFFWSLGKSFERGPTGMTVAIISTSCIFPAIALTLLFGRTFGHSYTLLNGMGAFLVIIGILWAGATTLKTEKWKSWTFFSSQSFFLHALFLIYLQWWAMLLNEELPLRALLPFHITTPHIHWFMPAIFFMAAVIQWLILFLTVKPLTLSFPELFYGMLSGISNGLCGYFLIFAPQLASSWENPMLFPIYSVGIIVFCNLWSQMLYKEKVNWKANTLCMAGLVIGTLAL